MSKKIWAYGRFAVGSIAWLDVSACDLLSRGARDRLGLNARGVGDDLQRLVVECGDPMTLGAINRNLRGIENFPEGVETEAEFVERMIR